ncbi:MAG TPA: hypothetical protein VOA87_15935 [Thermoanaerobaculia bacterium]|nr:hypothetical protein [Thermoanaerobaculia bacterium]
MIERFYRVLVSTSLRSGRRVGGRGEEVSGSLLLGEVDTVEGSFRALRQVELPPSPHRAGRRSVRGVAPFAGGIAACNTSQLFLFDRELDGILAVFSDRRFGDLHSIVLRDGVLYVAATAADSVLGIGANFAEVFAWWAGAEPELLAFGADHHRRRLPAGDDFRVQGRFRDRFHVNHVTFDEASGDMIVSLPDLHFEEGVSKFWNVTRRRFHLAGNPALAVLHGRIHDGAIFGGHHYFGWTEAGRFLKVCLRTGDVAAAVDCSVPLGSSTGNAVAVEHGWLRGAAHLDDELFLVGQSKLTLFLVDMERGERSGPLRRLGVEGETDDPGLAIYCIAKL